MTTKIGRLAAINMLCIYRLLLMLSRQFAEAVQAFLYQL